MKISALTSSSLVRKGDAIPSTFVPPMADSPRPGPCLEPTPVAPLLRPAGARHLRVCDDAKRIRVSVRLDPNRHCALKLIAAHTGRASRT